MTINADDPRCLGCDESHLGFELSWDGYCDECCDQ